MPDLAGHIARIAQDETLVQRDEANTSQTAVLPVLNAMGWEYWNTSEVVPQFRVGGGKVDYCLRDAGRDRDLVLIEVRRTGSDLSGESEQRQLTGYANAAGAPLACLTDGIQWWLYLTRTGQRFLSLDLRSQEASWAAERLERFLGRDSVVGGGAVEAAQAEFDSQERDRRVRAALEVAWQKTLQDPEGLLIDLVADAVEAEAGHRPEHEAVRQFVLGKMRQDPASPPASPPDADFTGQRPAAFWLDGFRHEAGNWRAVLTGVCELLVTEAGLRRFAQAVAPLRGKKRVYFSQDRSLLRMPIPIARGNFFIEGNFSANDQVRHARDALIAVRGPQGADSFRIDTTG